MVLQLFNDNIEDKKYKVYVRMMGDKIEQGVEVIESLVGHRYHLDLRVVRENKEKEAFKVKPGEDNLWSLVGLAAEIKRLKL